MAAAWTGFAVGPGRPRKPPPPPRPEEPPPVLAVRENCPAACREPLTPEERFHNFGLALKLNLAARRRGEPVPLAQPVLATLRRLHIFAGQGDYAPGWRRVAVREGGIHPRTVGRHVDLLARHGVLRKQPAYTKRPGQPAMKAEHWLIFNLHGMTAADEDVEESVQHQSEKPPPPSGQKITARSVATLIPNSSDVRGATTLDSWKSQRPPPGMGRWPRRLLTPPVFEPGEDIGKDGLAKKLREHLLATREFGRQIVLRAERDLDLTEPDRLLTREQAMKLAEADGWDTRWNQQWNCQPRPLPFDPGRTGLEEDALAARPRPPLSGLEEDHARDRRLEAAERAQARWRASGGGKAARRAGRRPPDV